MKFHKTVPVVEWMRNRFAIHYAPNDPVLESVLDELGVNWEYDGDVLLYRNDGQTHQVALGETVIFMKHSKTGEYGISHSSFGLTPSQIVQRSRHMSIILVNLGKDLTLGVREGTK